MTQQYKMTVDLNVLEHLGINLYSNVAAVLTEAVANAWDADSENVEIWVDRDSDVIKIIDDGVGMSIAEMSEKYLRVGYRRREEGGEHGKITKRLHRPVMGRKGLGKLSLFSIAECIEVQSVENGKPHGLRMTAKGIQEAAAEKRAFYAPEPLPAEQLDVTKGTKLVLRQLKKQRITRSVDALRKRLARRFSVIGHQHKFAIKINGTPVTVEDRGDLSKVQFLWTFEGSDLDSLRSHKALESEELPGKCEQWPPGATVRGWIGTAHTPKQLDSEEAGNLNNIVILSRGRLFHENVLEKVNDGRLYTKYLTGQLEVDFLDDNDLPDIATSDRQRIQESDERYEMLLQFLRQSLTKIEQRWNEWRRKHAVAAARVSTPVLADWLDSLPAGFRDSAESMVSKLNAIPIDDEENRRLLYRHGILAFERMRLRGSTEGLGEGVSDVAQLLQLLADRDAFENSLYGDIVRSRLDTIRDFQAMVDSGERERALQEYLFEHLWLLDPAWERATGSAVMESRLLEEGVIVEDLTEKEKLARIDIAYRTYAGKHIIVELKRASVNIPLIKLTEQGALYADKLKKILRARGERAPDVEIVFVVGQVVSDEEDNPGRVKNWLAGIAPGSNIVHYDELIEGARASYAEYLEKDKELDRVDRILENL